MDCKESILSNEVYDYITDYSLENVDFQQTIICYETIEDYYNIVYLNKVAMPRLEADLFEYQSVPKLYGLMQLETGGITGGTGSVFDPGSLIASGITQVQGPPLNLTGQGVVICIIDTGERVIIMSS